MIVVDASLAGKWLFPDEAHSDKALSLLAATLHAGEPILTPPLLWSEVANIVRQRMRRENLEPERAVMLLDQFLALSLFAISPESIYRQALLLAIQHNLPAVYDAHYVALAVLLHCDLWTDDQRLLRLLAGRLPFVRWIGDYEPDAVSPAGL